MTLRRVAPALAALFVAAAALACSSGGGDPDGAVLTVTRDGEVLARWSIVRIEAELEIVELTAGEESLRGPRLLDLIAASGVDMWARLRATGKGPGRAFDVVLDVESKAVSERWLLAFARRGDLRLASPELAGELSAPGVSAIKTIE